MISPEVRLRCLADELTASGELTKDWCSAFLSVPRHAFIPEMIWRDNGHTLVPFRRADDPDGWLALAYGAGFVITQVDDGAPLGPDLTGRVITSSASWPDVVAYMLAALDVEVGMTVCEIGTGTGYNAALLAARLGAENAHHVTGDFHASLAISLRVADCASIYCPINGCPGEYRVAFVDSSSKSWATVHYRPGATEYLVLQDGPRQLWAEVVTAYHWWRAAGSPAADRWRITVTPHEQLIDLATADEPPE